MIFDDFRLFASDALLKPQDGPKMAQESSKRSPRGPQDSAKSAQDRPKRDPRAPQEAILMALEGGGKSRTPPPSIDGLQDGPRSVAPKRAPRAPQESPRSAPRGAKTPPKSPKMTPRPPKERPRGPQDAPKQPKEDPKTPPKSPIAPRGPPMLQDSLQDGSTPSSPYSHLAPPSSNGREAPSVPSKSAEVFSSPPATASPASGL